MRQRYRQSVTNNNVVHSGVLVGITQFFAVETEPYAYILYLKIETLVRAGARHPGYAVTQRVRKRIEECFGWIERRGGMRKTPATRARNVSPGRSRSLPLHAT